MDDAPSEADAARLRRAFALAEPARARGDRPFAAVIVAEDGTTWPRASRPRAGGGGTLAHSEMNACRAVSAAEPVEVAWQQRTA
jgi:tRNA(Arg) A34 adenosine deaminase TadA